MNMNTHTPYSPPHTHSKRWLYLHTWCPVRIADPVLMLCDSLVISSLLSQVIQDLHHPGSLLAAFAYLFTDTHTGAPLHDCGCVYLKQCFKARLVLLPVHLCHTLDVGPQVSSLQSSIPTQQQLPHCCVHKFVLFLHGEKIIA